MIGYNRTTCVSSQTAQCYVLCLPSIAADVIDLYDDGNGGVRKGYTHVASNLPGVMQYLDLIRDAQVALGLRELDPTKVESNNCLTGEVYTEEDVRLQKKAVAFHRHKVDMAPKACKVTKDGERGNVGLPSPLYMMAGALSSGSDISDEGISVPKAETALGISASQSDHEEYWAGHGEYGWYVDDNDADVDNGGLYLPSRVGDRRDSDAADFEGASEEEEESSPHTKLLSVAAVLVQPRCGGILKVWSTEDICKHSELVNLPILLVDEYSSKAQSPRRSGSYHGEARACAPGS